MVGGVAVVGDNKETRRPDAFLQNSVGAIAGPFDSFLALRGLKTLALRMERHCENAFEIAHWLGERTESRLDQLSRPNEHIRSMNWPSARCARFGGMVTMILKTDLAGTRRFLENTHLFSLARALGGVESLMNHPPLMTHGAVPPEMRAHSSASRIRLVRLSVGVRTSKI